MENTHLRGCPGDPLKMVMIEVRDVERIRI